MEEFAELGLTKNELKTYECLIEFGKLSAAELSAKSTVPYGKIYNVLSSLMNKGFVKVIPEKTKKFSAGNPDYLLKAIKEKQENLDKLKEKVKEMQKFYDVEDKNPVSLGYGKKGFWKIANDLGDAKRYAYNIKWNSDYKEEGGKRRKRKEKKGIDFKDLVRYDKETKENVESWLKFSKNIRKIENEGIAISISDDEDVMIALIKSNVTLLIKDRAFAKIMKKLYLTYYDKAEKIE